METLKNLEKYKFYRKIFQIKVIEFRKPYLLILSIYSTLAGIAKIRSYQFFNMEISIFLLYILIADLESFSKYYNKIFFG